MLERQGVAGDPLRWPPVSRVNKHIKPWVYIVLGCKQHLALTPTPKVLTTSLERGTEEGAPTSASWGEQSTYTLSC